MACSNVLVAKPRAHKRQKGKGHSAKSLSSPQKVLLVSRGKQLAGRGEGQEQTEEEMKKGPWDLRRLKGRGQQGREKQGH